MQVQQGECCEHVWLDEAAALARERKGLVVLVHGDTHIYRDDEPFPGLRRIEALQMETGRQGCDRRFSVRNVTSRR